jgi:hypothetical protein
MATEKTSEMSAKKSADWLYWSAAATILVLGIYNLIIC